MQMTNLLIPGCLTTAPHAVVIPHPRRQTFSNGALLLTATTETSATTVNWENVEVPIFKDIDNSYRIGYHEQRPTYEVVDRLSIDAETAGLIGHQASSLGRTNCDIPFVRTQSSDHAKHCLPFPQRLVLPLLQNLHSRHSTFDQIVDFCGKNERVEPAVYSGIT